MSLDILIVGLPDGYLPKLLEAIEDSGATIEIEARLDPPPMPVMEILPFEHFKMPWLPMKADHSWNKKKYF